MMKTMTRGPVRYSPGVLFLCQWPYRALPEQKGKQIQQHYLDILISSHQFKQYFLNGNDFQNMGNVSWTREIFSKYNFCHLYFNSFSEMPKLHSTV